MSSYSSQTVRRVVLTGSIAAITATGAWYGAGLKTRQEASNQRQLLAQADPAETIQRLESVKANFVKQKQELQRKIDKFSAEHADSNEARMQHDGRNEHQ